VQERARRAPTSLHGRRRGPHHLGGLLHRKAAEEAELDQAGLVLVERGQLIESYIEQDHVHRLLLADRHGVFEHDLLTLSAAPRCAVLARVIEQDAAHLRRGHGQKMAPALHGGALVDQAKIGFVDQGGGLQRVLAAFAPEVAAGQAVQLVID
jgi:hypothetical protein